MINKVIGDSTMTFSNAQRLRPVRRHAIFQACALGFALALWRAAAHSPPRR
ncbi:fimbrial assembly domain protein [Xanthomonas citri pv. punicae str. LMG 859]|nr:fimbrial assembly domain protein [Xanthomonas citri pv. punicae str. LMG 859]